MVNSKWNDFENYTLQELLEISKNSEFEARKIFDDLTSEIQRRKITSRIVEYEQDAFRFIEFAENESARPSLTRVIGSYDKLHLEIRGNIEELKSLKYLSSDAQEKLKIALNQSDTTLYLKEEALCGIEIIKINVWKAAIRLLSATHDKIKNDMQSLYTKQKIKRILAYLFPGMP